MNFYLIQHLNKLWQKRGDSLFRLWFVIDCYMCCDWHVFPVIHWRIVSLCRVEMWLVIVKCCLLAKWMTLIDRSKTMDHSSMFSLVRLTLQVMSDIQRAIAIWKQEVIKKSIASCMVGDWLILMGLKGPWTPKLTYTFYLFSWKCRIFW